MLNLSNHLLPFNSLDQDDGEVSLHSLIREGRTVITPDLAKRILKEANYPGQRRVETKQTAVYAEMMRRGMWNLSDPISFAQIVGLPTFYLVNGQHRLNAVIEYGRPVEFRIAVNSVNDEHELRSLYFRFDAVMRVRTTEQILNASDCGVGFNLSKSYIKAVYDAVGFILNEFHPPTGGMATQAAHNATKIIDLRMEACGPWWAHAAKLRAAMSHGNSAIRTKILTGSRFAVALATMRYQPEKSEEFWRGVAEDDGLRKNDPRKVYLSDLYTRAINVGSAYQGVLSTANAWNAFFEGRQLAIIKVAENQKIRIAGTPYVNK